MKFAKLLLLSLFVGSIVAHSQGLMDHLLWQNVERLAGKGAPVIRTFKINENALIDMLPEYELAKIPLPKGEHTHITTGNIAKVAAFLGALNLNINEAIQKKYSNDLTCEEKKKVRNKVLLQTGLDVIKDYVVDAVQDKITNNLPESITERKVHPVIKWAAAQAGNAALGVVYDATAGRVIKAGFQRFGIKV